MNEFSEGLGLQILSTAIEKFNNYNDRKNYICNEILDIKEFQNVKRESIANSIDENKNDGYSIIGAIGNIIDFWEE